MKDEKAPAPRSGRRTFLMGLLTGAGVVTALGARRTTAAARPSASEPRPADPAAPILYRRTEEAERYYRTLYE